METGLLLLVLGATLYVMWWLIENDGAERIGDQIGLCRMKPPPGEEPTSEEQAAARAMKGRRPARPDPRVRRGAPLPPPGRSRPSR